MTWSPILQAQQSGPLHALLASEPARDHALPSNR